MKKSLVTTIAAAALIAGAGLASAQQTNMPGNTSQTSQDLYQNKTSGAENPTASKPGAPAKQGKSASVKKHHHGRQAMMKKHHHAMNNALKGTSQGRSATAKKSQPSSTKSQPGGGTY